MGVRRGGSAWYRHCDHLGSSRFASTQSRAMYSDAAYAPFGERYAQTGSTDVSSTGMNQDTVSICTIFLRVSSAHKAVGHLPLASPRPNSY